MSEFLTEINYDKLIEKSLKNVVVEALKIAERQGLPGEHHFYITFKTNHPQTRISDQLKSQYPEEMTIVIQHQFSNLIVETSGFGIDLSFGGIRQTLYIPFDAITYFADPYAKFGLSFNFDDEPISHNTDNDFAAEMALDITTIIEKHSQVDWTHNLTIHDRISQDIDDLFYRYQKERGLVLSFDVIDMIIENVKTVALRRFA